MAGVGTQETESVATAWSTVSCIRTERAILAKVLPLLIHDGVQGERVDFHAYYRQTNECSNDLQHLVCCNALGSDGLNYCRL